MIIKQPERNACYWEGVSWPDRVVLVEKILGRTIIYLRLDRIYRVSTKNSRYISYGEHIWWHGDKLRNNFENFEPYLNSLWQRWRRKISKDKNICDQLGCFCLSMCCSIDGDDNLARVVPFCLHDHESVLSEKQKSDPDLALGICIG